MRARRGEVGRTEILVALAIVAVLALITVPVIWSMSRKSRRDEVRENVDSIRKAEIEHMQAFNEYVSADAAPRAPHAVDAQSVPWVATDGFQRLGWAPAESSLRGSYSVTATRDGFTVHGSCDVDGDGHRALYEATDDEPTTLTTDAGVY
jgi:type II secretory pathway pseudopilin PulG